MPREYHAIPPCRRFQDGPSRDFAGRRLHYTIPLSRVSSKCSAIFFGIFHGSHGFDILEYYSAGRLRVKQRPDRSPTPPDAHDAPSAPDFPRSPVSRPTPAPRALPLERRGWAARNGVPTIPACCGNSQGRERKRRRRRQLLRDASDAANSLPASDARMAPSMPQ